MGLVSIYVCLCVSEGGESKGLLSCGTRIVTDNKEVGSAKRVAAL